MSFKYQIFAEVNENIHLFGNYVFFEFSFKKLDGRSHI